MIPFLMPERGDGKQYGFGMMCYSVNDSPNSEKEIPSAPSGVEPKTFRLLVRTLYH